MLTAFITTIFGIGLVFFAFVNAAAVMTQKHYVGHPGSIIDVFISVISGLVGFNLLLRFQVLEVGLIDLYSSLALVAVALLAGNLGRRHQDIKNQSVSVDNPPIPTE